MKPKYFLLSCFDFTISASCEDRQLLESETIPEFYRGRLSFSITQDGAAWLDVIGTANGIALFSERVKDAFETDGIKGMSFQEADISKIYDPTPGCGVRPNYFWGRAEGVLEFDDLTFKAKRRYVPISVSPSSGVDLFHFKYPAVTGGYACSLQVIEALRKHKVTNLFVRPVDYYEEKKRNVFIPPFHIDLTAEQWPPAAWYPEGFEPHPNNLSHES